MINPKIIKLEKLSWKLIRLTLLFATLTLLTNLIALFKFFNPIYLKYYIGYIMIIVNLSLFFSNWIVNNNIKKLEIRNRKKSLLG